MVVSEQASSPSFEGDYDDHKIFKFDVDYFCAQSS